MPESVCAVLRSYEDGIPTKTGGYAKSIPFDLCCRAWFLLVLEFVKSSRAEQDLLWRFETKQLRELLRRACFAIGLSQFDFELYSLRRSGATRDIANWSRDLITAKKMLRHAYDLPVPRCKHAGQLPPLFARMPVPTRNYAARIEPLLGRIFLLPARCPAPPAIHDRS